MRDDLIAYMHVLGVPEVLERLPDVDDDKITGCLMRLEIELETHSHGQQLLALIKQRERVNNTKPVGDPELEEITKRTAVACLGFLQFIDSYADNIRRVCADCAEQRKQPNPMYKDLALATLIDKYCQLGFPTPDGHREYMWVLVTGLAETEGEELRGELDNDPVDATDFTCGDVIEFSRSEIIAIIGIDEAN